MRLVTPLGQRQERDWIIGVRDASISTGNTLLVVFCKRCIKILNQSLIAKPGFAERCDPRIPASGVKVKRCQRGHSSSQRMPDKRHLVIRIFLDQLFDMREDERPGMLPGCHETQMHSTVGTLCFVRIDRSLAQVFVLF